ncbi:cystatin-2-like [Haemaphysalis longicornis]
MIRFVTFSAVMVAALGVVYDAQDVDYRDPIIIGGYETRDPKDPKYKELAHFAMSFRYDDKQEYWDTVLEMKEVQRQPVAGWKYRLVFTIAPSSCKMKEVEYTAEGCCPTRRKAKAACVAVVYEVSWKKKREVTSLKCN